MILIQFFFKKGCYRAVRLLQILYDGAVPFYVPLFIQIEKQVAPHCNS